MTRPLSARVPYRVYADTSVYGGAFDEEFQTPSRAFFDQVRQGRFRLVVSVVTQGEIVDAPEQVRQFYREMLAYAEVTDVSEEAVRLQLAYLAAGVVSDKWAEDALHVALATVAGCAAIVSWNFRHIVHFQKIPMYNAISELNGYRPIAIYSPSEVISYENEDV